MRKYNIGLLVLGGITLILTIIVLTHGVANRQDAQTERQARDIAGKLNNYVDTKQTVPANLKEAGIKDVPKTISYTKLSNTDYQFCVTYKNGNNVDSLSGLPFESLSPGSDYPSGSLIILSTHKKGKNCQTVQPYFTNYCSHFDTNYSLYCPIDQPLNLRTQSD